MKHLLILLENGVTAEVAADYKERLEERLGLPVTVLVGAKQALIIDTEVVETWPKTS